MSVQRQTGSHLYRFTMKLAARATEILIAALILFAPVSVSAALLRSMDLTQLCDHADTVVAGVVLTSGQAQELDNGRIVTEFSIIVHESIKGTSTFGDVLFIRQAGGQTPTKVARVPRLVSVKPGDAVVVFTRRLQDRFALVSADRGIWRIEYGNNDAILTPYDNHVERKPDSKPSKALSNHPVSLLALRKWVTRPPSVQLEFGYLRGNGMAMKSVQLHRSGGLREE